MTNHAHGEHCAPIQAPPRTRQADHAPVGAPSVASEVLALQSVVGNAAIVRAMEAARVSGGCISGKSALAAVQRFAAAPGSGTIADLVGANQAVDGTRGASAGSGPAFGSPQRGLAETVESAIPGTPTAGLTVQRKVGFEFESNFWAPWRRRRAKSESTPSHSGTGEPPTRHPEAGDTVEPVARQVVLQVGPGYRLEADDTPGPQRSNLEFVTDPFDETEAGLRALQRALDSMLTIVERLDKFVGRTGPGKSFRVESLDRFVQAAEHRLTGSAHLSGADLLLSGGRAGFPVKMQSTAGLPLADLPPTMESFGRNVPGETPEEAARRRSSRATVFPLNLEARPDDEIIGRAPYLARYMIAGLREHPGLTEALASDTSELTGFLAAAVGSIIGIQTYSNSLIKARLAFMPRNNFSQMFDSLPQSQRIALAKSPSSLIDEIVHALNEQRTRELIEAETPITANSPLIPGAPASSDLTIGEWVKGIVTGRDYLSQGGMSQWLAGREGIEDDERAATLSNMESIGTYTDDERREEDGERLFKFEHRVINPHGRQAVPLERAAAYAIEMLTIYMDIRKAGRERRSATAL